MFHQMNSVSLEFVITGQPQHFDLESGSMWKLEGTNTRVYGEKPIPVTIAYKGSFSEKQQKLLSPGRIMKVQNGYLSLNQSGTLIVITTEIGIGPFEQKQQKEGANDATTCVPSEPSTSDQKIAQQFNEYSDQNSDEVPLFS